MPEKFHIHLDDRGRWVFSANDSGQDPSSGAYRTYSEALDMLKNHLGTMGLAVSKISTHSTGMLVETRPSFVPTRPDITLRTSLSPELAKLIDGLSFDLGLSSVDTILQALVILKIVIDAGKEGKRIAITSGDLEVEREILIPGRPHEQG